MKIGIPLNISAISRPGVVEKSINPGKVL